MTSAYGPDTTNANEPVISVIKLKIRASDAAELVAASIDVLAEESRDLEGFLGAQVLTSVDAGTLVVLTEWSDHHAWSQSRYDARVGAMMEKYHTKASTIEFELYTRRKDFPRRG